MSRLAKLAAIAALVVAAAPARGDVSAAARAFADGQAAQLEGNFERAAQSYELAFTIAPSKEALRSAVRARQQANQLPRAATLASALLAQYPDDAESAKLANDVIGEARGKLARLAITCAPACTVALGGRAISLNAATSHVVFAPAGHHSLEVSFDGELAVTREVTVKVGDDLSLPFEPPPAPAKPASEPRATPQAKAAHDAAPAPAEGKPRPLSPTFVIAGGALTAALGGVALWSGLDTNKAHDAYVKAPTHAAFTEGRSKQLRTNILLGATAAAGVATGLIAVFWTQWGAPPAASHVAVTPTPQGATLSFAGRF
ncbi:MAG TPA: hypothetical protein VFP84_16425 [Kofleriaceae bacterium]|nr:hypothetical protein [Kofleriaceae bacterium]